MYYFLFKGKEGVHGAGSPDKSGLVRLRLFTSLSLVKSQPY
jgi:hypothetical protein